jgi:hypothetical protein
MKLTKLKINPRNPRTIDDITFDKLKQSITENEYFMEIRPIVVDENFMILGGTQRYKACCELYNGDIPDNWVNKVGGLTDKQKKEFILLDNSPKGYSGEWEVSLLKDMIIDMPLFDLQEDFGLFDFDIESDTSDDSFEPPQESDGMQKTFTCEHCGKESRK